MLCSFLLYSEVTQLYIYIYFFIFFSIMVYHRISNIFPWAIQGVLSRVQLFATLWTVACQAPLSMGFSRQEYWSGYCHALPPGCLPNPGFEPVSPVSSALGGRVGPRSLFI